MRGHVLYQVNAQADLTDLLSFAARRSKSRPSVPKGKPFLFKILICIIVAGAVITGLGSWWLQPKFQQELPHAQERSTKTELLAPPSSAFCQRARPPLVCAHGGDTTAAPPNTAPAFRAALAGGADCVEVDAALSSDGVLVVMHVRELAELLGRQGVQVGDMTSAQLLALRWPSGEAVMSVEEAVRLTSPFVRCVTLDVKTYNDKDGAPLDEEAISRALVALVAATRCANCLIWAKSDRVVRAVMALAPGQRTGYIVMNETAESRDAGMAQHLRMPGPVPAVVGAHWAMVDGPLMEELHADGKQLYVWTVNAAAVLRRMLDVGVDGLVTNYPLTALEAIHSRLAKCAARAKGDRAGAGAAAPAGALKRVSGGDYL